jgi:DNA-directed RNA polymerase specialized sigma24 family protein
MEYDDAYQELAIAELGARRRFRLDYETKNGEWATYETYLRRVLDGISIKLVARNLRSQAYSLDSMLGYGEEDSVGAESNQAFISYNEHRYKSVDWKIMIQQVAVDEVDVFIMEMLLDGWNQAEIANLLDYTQPAIRQRLNRYRDEISMLVTA